MLPIQRNLWHLMQGHRVTAVIYVAAKLGLAEHLRGGPRSVGELAEATGADKSALGRLLVALSTVGICAAAGEDRYSLTDMGASLDGEAEQSLKAWAIFEGGMLAGRWTGLLESIKAGKTAAQLAGIDNSFDMMARSPEKVGIFNAAMTSLTRIVTPGLLKAYDFGRISNLMDVGGGSGELVGAIACQYPNIRVSVFDIPACAEAARAHFARLGLRDRAKFVSGDFFQAIPTGADAIIMKSIIHDWSDERCATILKHCRSALPSDGMLLLVERILPESPGINDEDRGQAMSDLNMLSGPGGLERTEKKYRRLLEAAGFHPQAVYPAGLFSIIEARRG